VHVIDHVTKIFWNRESMTDRNPPDHQNPIFGLNLTTHIAAESSSTCLDVPRCQRGGKCALKSGAGCGDHVVDGGCMGLFYRGRVQAVMLSDSTMNSKPNGGGFRRELRRPNGACAALDPAFVEICWLGHLLSFLLPLGCNMVNKVAARKF
jgi:hypothetical protein